MKMGSRIPLIFFLSSSLTDLRWAENILLLNCMEIWVKHSFCKVGQKLWFHFHLNKTIETKNKKCTRGKMMKIVTWYTHDATAPECIQPFNHTEFQTPHSINKIAPINAKPELILFYIFLEIYVRERERERKN